MPGWGEAAGVPGAVRNPARQHRLGDGHRPHRKTVGRRQLRRHDREYRLIHLTLTAHKKKILTDLDLLAYTILPFQLANQMAHIRSISGEETSWTLENCTPASPLHPLLFPYPISDEKFTLTIILGHKRTALPIVTFYLNFFQLPISIV